MLLPLQWLLQLVLEHLPPIEGERERGREEGGKEEEVMEPQIVYLGKLEFFSMLETATLALEPS